jgi:hypothetical protein
VLAHKYREVRGEIEPCGRKASTWWNDIVSIKKLRIFLGERQLI